MYIMYHIFPKKLEVVTGEKGIDGWMDGWSSLGYCWGVGLTYRSFSHILEPDSVTFLQNGLLLHHANTHHKLNFIRK